MTSDVHGFAIGTFPVVDAVSLEPVANRRLRRNRRRPSDIPPQPYGTVLILQSGSQFGQIPSGGLDLAAAAIRTAVSIVVVSIEQQEVSVEIAVDSSDEGWVFAVTVSFVCRVTDPIASLEAGCWNVRPALRAYLLSNHRLRLLGTHRKVTDPTVGPEITAQIQAFYDTGPPTTPGLEVLLGQIHIRPWHQGDHRQPPGGVNPPPTSPRRPTGGGAGHYGPETDGDPRTADPRTADPRTTDGGDADEDPRPDEWPPSDGEPRPDQEWTDQWTDGRPRRSRSYVWEKRADE